MNGFETITILGGYLILFGIFCAFVKEIQFLPTGLRACILAFLEITNTCVPSPCFPLAAYVRLCRPGPFAWAPPFL